MPLAELSWLLVTEPSRTGLVGSEMLITATASSSPGEELIFEILKGAETAAGGLNQAFSEFELGRDFGPSLDPFL